MKISATHIKSHEIATHTFRTPATGCFTRITPNLTRSGALDRTLVRKNVKFSSSLHRSGRQIGYGYPETPPVHPWMERYQQMSAEPSVPVRYRRTAPANKIFHESIIPGKYAICPTLVICAVRFNF